METRARSEGLPTRMKALRAHARGGPEKLIFEDAPLPGMPSGTDVCVQVTAAAITFDELTWPETWQVDGVDRTPIIPSHEVAGVVAATGPEVKDLTIGDDVFGLVPFDRDGAAAEYVLVPDDQLTRKPGDVSDVEAAAAVLPALTASEALTRHLGLGAGQRLLIRGGIGAVGSFLTQFAHRSGIEVTSTVRTPADVERAKQLGADEVLVADDPVAIPTATFDAAIDAAGADTPEWAYRAVRPGGPVILLQEPPDPDLADRWKVAAAFFVVSPSGADLARLAAQLAGGDVDVAVGDIYPLSEGRAAYASRGRARNRGKTVLRVTSPSAALKRVPPDQAVISPPPRR